MFESVNSYPTRTLDRLRWVLRAGSLDRQLALGVPSGWSRSLTVRAYHVTDMEYRRAVAQNWERLLDACRQPVAGHISRAPLCRDRILSAQADIDGMVAALSEPGRESAAGVAMASLLLRDGSGPLYNRHCTMDLPGELRDITRHLQGSAVTQGWR